MNHWLKIHRRKEIKKRLKQAKDWPGAAIWYGDDSQRQDWWNMRPQGDKDSKKGIYGLRIES